MTDLTIADYSEFQGKVTPSNQQIVIIRAHNGWRADIDFAANRQAAHDAGCAAVGLYAYLPAGIDAKQAAGMLLQTIGRLLPNEWLICDLEEGAGDQQSRWQAWRTTIMLATARVPWLYSGLAFAEAHNLDPEWVAAYQPGEPTVPHKLWQDTDAYPWPWAKSDASIFHGSLADFLVAAGVVNPTAAAVAAPLAGNPAAPTREDPAVTVVVYADQLHTFHVSPSGDLVHHWTTGAQPAWGTETLATGLDPGQAPAVQDGFAGQLHVICTAGPGMVHAWYDPPAGAQGGTWHTETI